MIVDCLFLNVCFVELTEKERGAGQQEQEARLLLQGKGQFCWLQGGKHVWNTQSKAQNLE